MWRGPMMAAVKPKFQTVKDRLPIRTLHVWVERSNGVYKCVICGGLTCNPGDEVDCDTYEPLTDEEKALCPPYAEAKR